MIIFNLFLPIIVWGNTCGANTELDCLNKNVNDSCTKSGSSSESPATCVADGSGACTCTIGVASNSTSNSSATVISLENPIGSEKDAGLLGPVMKIVNGLLGIIGALALVAFVYGGFQWLISAGNAEKVKTGTTTMIWAILGLFLIFSSYAILKLITDALGGR